MLLYFRANHVLGNRLDKSVPLLYDLYYSDKIQKPARGAPYKERIYFDYVVQKANTCVKLINSVLQSLDAFLQQIGNHAWYSQPFCQLVDTSLSYTYQSFATKFADIKRTYMSILHPCPLLDFLNAFFKKYHGPIDRPIDINRRYPVKVEIRRHRHYSLKYAYARE